jgi:Divergent InlB B-repeat domain
MDRVGARGGQRGTSYFGTRRLRFTALIFFSAAIALAVVLPAAASASQTLTVTLAGTGTGTVTSSPSGIDCGGSCSSGFADNSAVILTGASGPITGAVVWTGCQSVNLENQCKVTMSAAKAVTATFDLIQRQLKVVKTGSGTGTVESSPAGIECGAKCAASYVLGTSVTLSAVPGPNSLPVEWSGCGKIVEAGDEKTCEVTMSAVKAVTATFDLNQVQLKVTEAGPGTGILIGTGPGAVTSSPAGISCGATCASDFDQGSTVTLTAAEGLNSELAQWSGCDKVAGNKCEVTMSAARAVTATYGVKPLLSLYTVSVVKAGTGFGTVTSSPSGIDCGSSCTAEVLSGFDPTLTAVPAEGSIFSHWSGGGCSGSGLCKKPVKASHTVKAFFTAVGVRKLALTITGTGTGTVKSKAVGIECSVSCSPSIKAGTKVRLTAVAGSGSTFAGFSGECSGAKVCKVQMSDAHSVIATFVKTPVPLPTAGVVIAKVAKVKGGKALVGVRCGGPASCRGSLKLLARLDKGKKRLPIGSATFSLAPGSSTVLKVKLSVKAKQALKSKGRLKAKGMGAGIQAQTIQLTL